MRRTLLALVALSAAVLLADAVEAGHRFGCRSGRSVSRSVGYGTFVARAGNVKAARRSAFHAPYSSIHRRAFHHGRFDGRHHGRHYLGIRYRGRPAYGRCGGFQAPYRPGDLSYPGAYGMSGYPGPYLAETPLVARPTRPRPLTRADIEMVPIRVAEREPMQRPVMRTITLADGRTTTVITSEPIDDNGTDEAPERLARSDGD